MNHLVEAFTVLENSVATFEARLSVAALAYLKDHKTEGRCTLHTSTLLEIVAEASMVLDSSAEHPPCLRHAITSEDKELNFYLDTMLCSINVATGNIVITGNSCALLTATTANTAQNQVHIGTSAKKRNIWHVLRANKGPIVTAPGLLSKEHLEQVVTATIKPQHHHSSGYITHPALTHATMTAQHFAHVRNSNSHLLMAACASIILRKPGSAKEDVYITSTTIEQATNRKHMGHGLWCMSVQQCPKVIFLDVHLQSKSQPHALKTGDSSTLSLNWRPFLPKDSSKDSENLRSNAKWLLISQNACNTKDLCCKCDTRVTITSVLLGTSSSPGSNEICISGERDLIHLLSSTEADHCLLVHDLQQNAADVLTSDDAKGAMLWVFRAFAKAQPNFKLNLVFISADMHSGNVPPKAVLSQGDKSINILPQDQSQSQKCTHIDNYMQGQYRKHSSYYEYNLDYRRSKDAIHGRQTALWCCYRSCPWEPASTQSSPPSSRHYRVCY